MAALSRNSYFGKRPIRLLVAGLLGLVVFSACERPFVPPSPPEITVIQPSLSNLFIEDRVELRVRASSFREVSRLEIDGIPMTFDTSSGHWVDTLTLAAGLNTFIISAFDIEEVEGMQELSLARLDPSFSTEGAPDLPLPWRIGGHTASLLDDGSVLIAGGAISTTSPAVNRSFIWREGGEGFELLEAGMFSARTGHTASRMPDGRILFIGGAARENTVSRADLIETVEIFDPQTETFSDYPVVGTPISRVYHTTFLTETDDGVFVDVFGGIGRFDNSGSDEVAIRRDFRTFRITNDTLFAIPGGQTTINGIDGSFGQAVAPIEAPSSLNAGRFIVTGTTFLDAGREDTNVHFRINYNVTPIRIGDIAEHLTLRTRHTGVALQDGIAVFFGGRQDEDPNPVATSEVYLARVDRFFAFPNTPPSIPRFGHTATKLPSNRILIVGGFLSDGNAIRTSEWFDSGF